MAQPTQPEQQQQQPSLKATYTSPENAPFQISQQLELQLPSSDLTTPEESKQQRIQYLSQLRKAASQTQQTINKELTARMEEDKTREAEVISKSDGPSNKKKKVKVVDDEEEEQNYGEEVVEDSD